MKPVIIQLSSEKNRILFLQNGGGRAVIRKILRSAVFHGVQSHGYIPFDLEQKTKKFYFLHQRRPGGRYEDAGLHGVFCVLRGRGCSKPMKRRACHG